MLVEIRHYRLEPGRRAEFVEWFESAVVPEMERHGMRILGTFEPVDDPDAFVYLRGFRDEEERRRQTGAFYEGEAWLGGLRDRALELETGFDVLVVRSTPGSRL